MKIELELTSEQVTKLLDAITATYEDLDNKLKHLKGRVRRLEENLDYLINRVKTLEGSRTI